MTRQTITLDDLANDQVLVTTATRLDSTGVWNRAEGETFPNLVSAILEVQARVTRREAEGIRVEVTDNTL